MYIAEISRLPLRRLGELLRPYLNSQSRNSKTHPEKVGYRRVILDVALGTFGPVTLDPAHALFGRLRQARRTSSVYRCDAGRPACADTSADRISTHADGRSAGRDRTGTVVPEGRDRRGLLRRNPAWRLEIGRGRRRAGAAGRRPAREYPPNGVRDHRGYRL